MLTRWGRRLALVCAACLAHRIVRTVSAVCAGRAPPSRSPPRPPCYLANGTATLIAQIIEPSGFPPHSGTRRLFTTTLGTLEPNQAETNSSGLATVTFRASGSSNGTARITATSGTGHDRNRWRPIHRGGDGGRRARHVDGQSERHSVERRVGDRDRVRAGHQRQRADGRPGVVFDVGGRPEQLDCRPPTLSESADHDADNQHQRHGDRDRRRAGRVPVHGRHRWYRRDRRNR